MVPASDAENALARGCRDKNMNAQQRATRFVVAQLANLPPARVRPSKSASLNERRSDVVLAQIDIGNAATPMTVKMPQGVMQPYSELAPEPVMDVQIVANEVLHMARLSLDANILTMTVMATKMPFVGRG